MESAPVCYSRREVKRQLLKANGYSSACEMLKGVELRGCEVYGLTMGQFSLMELITVLIERSGSAVDVDISTWTAAEADPRDAYLMLEKKQIKNLRFVVDRSFETRQPEYCKQMIELFGRGCIRICRTHAKLALIRGDHNLVVRTSMNLNRNTRIENFEISDDGGLMEFSRGIFDQLFETGVSVGGEPHAVAESLHLIFN